MRPLNGGVRNQSVRVLKTANHLGSMRKPTPSKDAANSDHSDTKSLRCYQTESTKSTNASSKINSDNAPRELSAGSKLPSSANSLFKTSPAKKPPQKARILRPRPSKVCSLNHGQVMVNRWLGTLKSKLPHFDMDDLKTLRAHAIDSNRRQTAPEYSQPAYI